MSTRPPDWQLPPGVTPGLWEYLHAPAVASRYLEHVSESPFALADRRFVENQLTVPGRVIDLGCGPGRSLAPLAERGFDCTGVDLSTLMLDEAKRAFADRQLPAVWVQANLGEPLPFSDASFDAALCLFGTLGMLHPEPIRRLLLGEIQRIVTPAGKLLLHVHNRWPIQGLAGLFRKQSVVTMPVHQGISQLQMRLYSLGEAAAALRQSGWMVETIEYVDARSPDGSYRGPRWLAPCRADGFLIAARSTA